VNAQNERLRTQLKESKTYEKALQEQINRAEDKYLDLYQTHEKLKMFSNSEEMEAQLSIMQRKMVDVKFVFGCIDIIKIQCIEEVKTYKICYIACISSNVLLLPVLLTVIHT